MLKKHNTKVIFAKESSIDPGVLADYTRSTGTITIYDAAFHNPFSLSETVLHEMVHYYIGDMYYNSKEFKHIVDTMMEHAKSYITEKEASGFYGFTSGEEFVTEILTNTSMRNYLKFRENDLWNRFKRFIARLLKRQSDSKMSITEISEMLTGVIEQVRNNRETVGEKDKEIGRAHV